jgi:hypothetical protein
MYNTQLEVFNFHVYSITFNLRSGVRIRYVSRKLWSSPDLGNQGARILVSINGTIQFILLCFYYNT